MQTPGYFAGNGRAFAVHAFFAGKYFLPAADSYRSCNNFGAKWANLIIFGP